MLKAAQEVKSELISERAKKAARKGDIAGLADAMHAEHELTSTGQVPPQNVLHALGGRIGRVITEASGLSDTQLSYRAKTRGGR
jgi:hypothetical protein